VAVDQALRDPSLAPAIPLVEVDETAARRTLRGQIARLESELSAAFVSAFPRTGIDFNVAGRGGPRLLSLGELERLRDDLADRVQQTRRQLAEQVEVEAANRLLLEEMLLEPGRHRWLRIDSVDIGEPGCRNWEVRPRLGIIGMLMGWWRVKVSSGCPLSSAEPELGSADVGTSKSKAPRCANAEPGRRFGSAALARRCRASRLAPAAAGRAAAPAVAPLPAGRALHPHRARARRDRRDQVGRERSRDGRRRARAVHGRHARVHAA